MFKKIHSNRDPRDTLYSELRKEFSVYADKGNRLCRHLASQYPRFLFGLMIVLLTLSAVLAIVVHRQMLPQKKVAAKRPAVVIGSSLDQILAAGKALKTTIYLRRQVDSITDKKVLSKDDSLILVRDLDSLQHIRPTLPH